MYSSIHQANNIFRKRNAFLQDKYKAGPILQTPKLPFNLYLIQEYMSCFMPIYAVKL